MMVQTVTEDGSDGAVPIPVADVLARNQNHQGQLVIGVADSEDIAAGLGYELASGQTYGVLYSTRSQSEQQRH